MQNIKTKDVVVYCTLPRVFPRFRHLFSTGFSYIAFLMAHIYSMIRILPEGHPYTLQQNMGRFGILNVIAEATRHLKLSIRHVDQVLIYFALLAGFGVLLAQFLMIAYMIFAPILMPAAMAFSWFDTADPATDVAYSLLDRVFGVPDVFCSSVTPANCTDYSADTNGDGTAGPAIPMPFHSALHGLFRFYSTALLLIAVLIFLYFVVVIVLETVVSGTPFGQRFQNVWVPVRLVVAIGLLMPINFGLGSGQFIVLYAAKWGSSFATNGWNGYIDGVSSHTMFGGVASSGNPMGERSTFLAMPEMPDITPLIETMSLVHACAYAHHRMVAGSANPYASSFYKALNEDYTIHGSLNSDPVQPFLVKEPTTAMVAADGSPVGGSTIIGDDRTLEAILDYTDVPYMNALGFYYGGDIVIRFGEYGVDFANEVGSVLPRCGDVRIPVYDLSDPDGANNGRGGASHMLRFYYRAVKYMWFSDLEMRQFARAFVSHSLRKDRDDGLLSGPGSDPCAQTEVLTGAQLAGVGNAQPVGGAFQPDAASCRAEPPTVEWRKGMITRYETQLTAGQGNLRQAIVDAWTNYVVNGLTGDYTQDMIDLGWGGAGVWYNRIAEVNGGWIDAVNGVPSFDNYPLVMEQIRSEKARHEQAESRDRFNPSVPAGAENSPSDPINIDLGEGVKRRVGQPLSDVYDYWNKDDVKNPNNLNRVQLQNVFVTAMNMLLGTQGLAAMRTSNKHLHPLAQLVAVGKGLVDSAVFHMAASSATAFLGGALSAFDKAKGVAAFSEAISQVFFSMAFMGLTVGFVLFYILPFLPFIYFYFAVASWVKSIFEAMVGVPLWALAHLRIDGDGLPGDAAQNGYFLVMEIFIRPILTVVGLIAAIGIFATQVRVLNLIWDLVAANTAGFTPNADVLGMGEVNDARFRRGIVDQFFFTVIYAVVCYMMAIASFKLIDKIPDNILRWAGAGVSSFGDIDQESIDSISRYASVGGMTIGNQAAGAIRDVAKGGGAALGKELKDFIGTGGGTGTGGSRNPPPNQG